MAATTTEVIGTIGAIQTLIENFPMSIFDLFGNKTYSNPIEFIMDVLKQLGITDMVLIDKLIEFFFDVPNAIEIYNLAGDYVYRKIKKPTEEQIKQAVEEQSVPTQNIDVNSPNYIVVDNVYYYKHKPIPTEPQSEFLNGIEYSVKGIVQNILTGLLSCSIIPEIPEEYLTDGGYSFNLPKDSFDITGLLNIYPLGEIGNNFYSGVDDENINVNTLYRTFDLNAFIWYVLNRGNEVTTVESNKMLWDSRVFAEHEGDYNRSGDTQWQNWLSSGCTSSALTVNSSLHPILRFKPTDIFGYNNGIEISFPRNTWDKDELFNESIYRFNDDYLKNIQIFNPRLIISEMINSLLNGNITKDLNIQYSVQTKAFEAKLDEIIRKALEVDDLTVDDCFFSFSNDEFNEALRDMELQRYGAKELNTEASPAIKIKDDVGIDALNTINSMATMNEKITSISRTVYDISTIPAQDDKNNLSIGYNEKWLNDVVIALVKPLAKALLTPKVMLLFLINFQIMGLVKIEDIHSFNEVLDLIIKKMISIIISLVKYIRDKIIEFLMNLFFINVKPLLIKWGVLVLNEKLADWIALLEEAIACIPLFRFNRGLNQIDDVNYADITQKQETPETEKSC